MNNDKLNEIVKRLHGDFFVSCVASYLFSLNFNNVFVTIILQRRNKITF